MVWILPVAVGLWSVLLWIPNTYEGFRSRSILMHGFTAATTCALGMLLLFAAVTVFKQYYVNRSLIGIFGLTAFLGVFLTRAAAMAFLSHYTQKGYDRHYVVVGGIQSDGVFLAETLEAVRGGVFQV